MLDTTLSFTAPFVAFLPAQAIHASGVLAVVVTGLLLGHKAPTLQSAASRISESINWATVQFLLENGVFLLIGLLCFVGLFGVLAALLPVPAIVPILLYIGLLIGAQASAELFDKSYDDFRRRVGQLYR